MIKKKASRTDFWLSRVRDYARGFAKRADLGGEGNDMPFEQAFSNLAHAYLRDKAPSLLDYEVGFQLVERNEENTKAVGVFGFQVGSQWLYAPVFFLNGDLKGHELLYIKNQDLFVPMKENWLTHILNRRPFVLGDQVPKNTRALGSMPPDFYQFTQSPNKFASHMPRWVQDFLPVLAQAVTTDHYAVMRKEAFSLPQFLKDAGDTKLVGTFIKLCQRYPKIAQAYDKFHGVDSLAEVIAHCKTEKEAHAKNSIMRAPMTRATHRNARTGSIMEMPLWQHPIKTGELEVITRDYTETEPPAKLDLDDREKLLRDGMLVKDRRVGDEVSVAYNIRTEQKLRNPHETGLYQVLVKPGKFERMLIIMQPHGPTGRKNGIVVVRLEEGQRNWSNLRQENVWVADKEETPGEDAWNEWLEEQTEATSLDSSRRKRYVLVGPRGEGTLPFEVRKSLGESYGYPCYEVRFEDHIPRRRGYGLGYTGIRYDDEDFDDDYCRWEDGERIHLQGKDGTRLRSSRGDVWIPKGFRLVSVKEVSDDEDENCYVSPIPEGRSDPPPIKPGNLLDVELELISKTAGLKIWTDGNECELNGDRMSMRGGLYNLIVHHGFREKTARSMIKQAQAKGKKEFRVKYAQGYGGGRLTDTEVRAPYVPEEAYYGYDPFMASGVPTQQRTDYAENVPGMEGEGNIDSYYPLDNVEGAYPGGNPLQAVQEAANQGQKEVFDTSMIGQLLKAVRDDTMIDRYMGDLMKGMDRLGRILFLFYWHSDDFSERYGKEEMPELEDALRNSFEAMGDVILFLKQKSVEPYPEEVSDVDLAAVAE